MFEHFFNAYKYEVYKVKNKITWKKIKKLKRHQQLILLGMIASFVICIVAAARYSVMFATVAISGIVLSLIALAVSTRYSVDKNKIWCDNYRRLEIDEVKKLLKRAEFSVFNSENGIDYLIEACHEKMHRSPLFKNIVDTLLGFFKIIVVPVIVAIISVGINNMPIKETLTAGAILALLGIFMVVFIRVAISPFEDLITKNQNIARELGSSLKYIKLTVEEDSEKTMKLIF